MLRSMLAAAFTSSLLTVSLSPSDLAFAPAAGTRVTRTWTHESEMQLDEWSARTNGEAIPSEYLPQLDLSSHNSATLEMQDEELASAGGHPTKLRRTYDAVKAQRHLEFALNGTTQLDTTVEGHSKLVGCVVLFDESAKAGERRKLEKGQCDGGLVDALALDLDVSALVANAGDAPSWEVDGPALNLMPQFLGGAKVDFETSDDRRHTDPAQLERNWGGTWKVTRGAESKVAGYRVIELKLDGHCTTKCEIESELENVPVAQGPTTEKAEVELSAHGTLVWNLELHVLHSLDVDGTYTMHHLTATKEKGASGAAAYEQTMEFSGKVHLAVESSFQD